LVVAAGASYAARWTTAHAEQLREAMKKGLRTKGFALIEVVSHCPTAFGRRVGLKTIVNILDWLKENSVPLEQAEKMTERDLEGKIVVGEFVHRELPTYTENVYAVIKEAKKSAKED
jgi:2-oxoglutarate ferredoxin oxidoreductase subunit beta